MDKIRFPLAMCIVLMLGCVVVAGTLLDLSSPPVIPQCSGMNWPPVMPTEKDLEMMVEAGIKVVRTDLAWGFIEQEIGKYDFDRCHYNEMLSAFQARGIGVMFILDYGNTLHTEQYFRGPYTQKQLDAYARYVRACAENFKGKGIIYEIWNEPNAAGPEAGFWRPEADPVQYTVMAKLAAKTLREVDPSCLIIGPACAGADWRFFEKCFQEGLLDDLDVVSFHPYRVTGPETALVDYERLREMIAKYSKGRTLALISSEWGYPSGGHGEETEAQFLARQWLTNLLSGVRISIWYEWRDPEESPDTPGWLKGTGIIKEDFSIKPAYLAAKTLNSELAGFRFVKRMNIGSVEDYALLLTNGDSYRLALWTTGLEHEIILPLGAGSARIVQMTGEVEDRTSSDANWRLMVNRAPQYVTPPAESKRLALEARVSLEVRRTQVLANRPPGDPEGPSFHLKISNPTAEPLTGAVAVSPIAGLVGQWQKGPRFSLEPRQSSELVWCGACTMDRNTTLQVPVRVSFAGEREALIEQAIFHVASAPKKALLDFESQESLRVQTWQGASVNIEQGAYPEGPTKSMKVSYKFQPPSGSGTWVSLSKDFHKVQDWSGYEGIAFRLYFREKPSVSIALHVVEESGAAYKSILEPPRNLIGWTTYRVGFFGTWLGTPGTDKNGKIDLDRIKSLTLTIDGTNQSGSFLIDDVTLCRYLDDAE